jgi:hypothetical protein
MWSDQDSFLLTLIHDARNHEFKKKAMTVFCPVFIIPDIGPETPITLIIIVTVPRNSLSFIPFEQKWFEVM